ncbi:late secretory pathway protein AVL9 homolog [Uranotaenia lowii]|uniref:late secretory pathway protein AVL9 homolog n=1 Tax=Uranotaenia lowii TaxID=190385 RepID=UPI00247ABA78|nr:late secretory pathway protein AVL9 homolog [Uranotaenia lowii]
MDVKKPILHIFVVGFHHKKGCQVEFSYPPLIAGSEGKQECPSGWKYLPTLALPDGSHNFNKDFVCFNLPSLVDPHESIYGISCYRQIPVEELKIRTADVTRSTVQKAVCALLAIPIYGYVEVKLSLIAHAFFEQGDFSCTDILVKAYEQLNACLMASLSLPVECALEPELLSSITMTPSRLHFVGLPLRDLVLKWRHKLLMLFKLILLQKRLVCFGSPVQPICSLILGVVSLHPELLTKAFQEVACVKTSRPMSPMPNFGTPQEEKKSFSSGPSSPVKENVAVEKIETIKPSPDLQITPVSDQDASFQKDADTVSMGSTKEATSSCEEAEESTTSDGYRNAGAESQQRPTLARETSMDTIASNFASLCAVKSEDWVAPLRVFHEGNLCLPYISLPYMDLLSDPAVKGYIIGASNVLFQQKRQLADVMIHVESAVIDIFDLELKRAASLSTEDLRFADFIIRNVQNPKEDAEGSEVWIREQFYGYMVALLKSSTCPEGSRELEHFNVSFMTAFKGTQCYQDWLTRGGETVAQNFEALAVGHPFAGNLSVADMKLRIAQTMQNSESGRKLNQAVNSTSRVVGGALTTAKGAFSTWWTSITAVVPQVPAGPAQDPNLAQDGNNDAQSKNASSGHYSDTESDSNDGDPDDDDLLDDSSSYSDQSQSDGNRKVDSERIETAEVTSEKTNNIIEIGKEAEMLNRTPKIFNV